MIHKSDVSLHINRARKRLIKAHKRADTWTEDMEHTAEAIKALGIQHYGQSGEDMPDRIIAAQAEAMASLAFSYSELAYEAENLTFEDENEREKFEKFLDAGHEEAMTALWMVESERGSEQ